MRIAVLSLDTRGGIQPYIALALGLKRDGHEVRLLAPSDFVPMAEAWGLRAFPLSGSIEDALRKSDGATERGKLASIRYAREQSSLHVSRWTAEVLAACEGVDLMTGGIGGMVVGEAVAERLGVPFVQTHLQPVGAPTAAFPGVLFPGLPRWVGGLGRRFSHSLSELALWAPFKGPMRRARVEVLGLSRRPAKPTRSLPVLYGFSPHVIPRPADWSAQRHITGYWNLPAEPGWSPPAGLEAFLAAGPAPVSLGFGSMTSEDPQATTALVFEAVRRAGVRAVVLSGWGAMAGDAPLGVFVTSSAPHDWLFPRVAAAVHHGGAGTTGAALRAGVPAIVVPFTMDQPFWGSRVAALGVGPAPIPRRQLSVETLAAALHQAVTDGAMTERASLLGQRLREEDGVGQAVAHFAALG